MLNLCRPWNRPLTISPHKLIWWCNALPLTKTLSFVFFVFFVFSESRGCKIWISTSAKKYMGCLFGIEVNWCYPRAEYPVWIVWSFTIKEFTVGGANNSSWGNPWQWWWWGNEDMTLNTVCLPSSGHNCPRQTLPHCVYGGCEDDA